MMRGNLSDRTLSLPAWGPYSKRYAGISHLPDRERGVRFDLSVFPGYYRGRIDVPNVKWESSWYPWEASADLRYYSNRHELEWKDRLYIDVSWLAVDETTRLVRCECVNRTDAYQSVAIQLFAGVAFPEVDPGRDEVLDRVEVTLPEKSLFHRAVEYERFEYATPRPTDNLMPDALKRGEITGQGFVGGCGIGRGFGAERGDRVAYRFEIDTAYTKATLLLRVRSGSPGPLPTLGIEGVFQGKVRLREPGFHTVGLDVGPLGAGAYRFEIVGQGDGPVDIDSFCIVETSDIDSVTYRREAYSDVPEITRRSGERSLSLHYPSLDELDPGLRYGIAWEYGHSVVREFVTDHLDELLRRAAHDHVSSRITDRWRNERDGDHYTNVFMRPVVIAPESNRVVWACVTSGSEAEVAAACDRFLAMKSDERERYYESNRSSRILRPGTADGEHLRLSQEIMATTALTNVVYPVRCVGRQKLHYTPGRWWNTLYTWDSGFVGLGLLELDADRAIDCLNMYCTDPDDEHRAFVHHGTPVPVQIYLFQEIWNRTADAALLDHFYPSLKRFHEFLAGRLGSSTTGRLGSHLLKTWDYFYNSGGWDDYPPQVHVHRNRLTRSVSPVANTAHAIRTAKILKAAASRLGLSGDVEAYDADIRTFTTALQEHAYDPDSGYFSYVTHDETGSPTGALRHESGENFNMGLDGTYPFVAGICTEEQEKRIAGYLGDESRLWTDIGLSTVDRSAAYYRIDGYWNGAVWFPHQWFYWKSCLDLGYVDLAWKIARTALELWSSEVKNSYNCFEHFIIETKRGAGWHQFSGLSSPVLLWYGAYYQPRRLTFGFDVWLESAMVRDAATTRVELRTLGPAGGTVSGLYRRPDGKQCRISWKGADVTTREVSPGVMSFELPRSDSGLLEIVDL